MEIINWIEEDTKGSDLVAWLLLETMTRESPNILQKFPDMDVQKLQVEMIINGVSVPVMETSKSIESQLDKLITNKAKNMLEERFYRHEEALNALKEHIMEQLDEGYTKERLSNGEN